MIDLHIHTTYSDGTDSVIEILKKAQEADLEIISITDHDKVDAYFELDTIDIVQYYTGKIVKGSEIRSIYHSIPIEILGYGINPQRIKESKYIVDRTGNTIQEKYLQNIKKIGKQIGLKFSENIHLDNKNIFAAMTFAKEIFQYPENEEIIKRYNLGEQAAYFYRNGPSNPESIFYINESDTKVAPEIIIQEIHEAGGLAFLAHPFVYPFKNKLETIKTFVQEYKIDGLECYYSLFRKEQTKELLEICQMYNLYVSGGSDYHGMLKPDIFIGKGRGNLSITRQEVEEWINKVM